MRHHAAAAPARRTDAQPGLAVRGVAGSAIRKLIDSWFSVTYVMNNLNRGLGLADAYPFVWSAPAIDKLRYVHETVRDARGVNG